MGVGLGWVDENRPKDNYGVAGFDGRWPSGNLPLNVRVLSIYTKRTFAFGRISCILLLVVDERSTCESYVLTVGYQGKFSCSTENGVSTPREQENSRGGRGQTLHSPSHGGLMCQFYSYASKSA